MIEEISWRDWSLLFSTPVRGTRVYVGDACCEKRLPHSAQAVESAMRLRELGVGLTLVTPLVTDAGLNRVKRLVEDLLSVVDELEVVCNDWGALEVVAALPRCRPIVGRMLVRQDTDPRWYGMFDEDFQKGFEREVRHVDGSVVQMRYAPPSPRLLEHIRRPSLDQPEIFESLARRVVNRFEVNNLLQGLSITGAEAWSVSLHVPDVLITTARDCSSFRQPEASWTNCGDDKSRCSTPVEWRHDSFPAPLYQLGNALYYLNYHLPSECESLGVDRIIKRLVFGNARKE